MWFLLVVCMWLCCCLLSGAVLVWLLLFYFCWGSTTAICVALLVVLWLCLFLCHVVDEYFWRWISFSSFWVASWTTSWSGVFLLRSSSAIEWFVSEFSLVGGCRPFVCRGVEVACLLVDGVFGCRRSGGVSLEVWCAVCFLFFWGVLLFCWRWFLDFERLATACGVSC